MNTQSLASKGPSRLHCGHCNEYLSKTVYYQHKRLFYDRRLKKWYPHRVIDRNSLLEAAFSPTNDYKQEDPELNSHCQSDDDQYVFEPTFNEDHRSEEIVSDEPLQHVQSIEVHPENVSSVELEIIGEGTETFEHEEEHSQESYGALLRLYTFFLLMFQSLFRLSDTALTTLLTFLAMFFSMLNRTVTTLPEALISKLPRNVQGARVLAGSNRSTLQQFVCCPSCHSIYKQKNCIIEDENGKKISQKCSYRRFPNHPQLQHRGSCNTLLMKRVKLSSGRVLLKPNLIYCYKSVIESLQEMLKRDGLQQKCELWRKRDPKGFLEDVYDGQIWKDFLDYDTIPFLSVANNYAFQLNVDWFQPFEHTQHSEGAIYMTLLNLPRQERFLQENIILVGVMPGPKEPHIHINSFLSPLVEELKLLWQGVPVVLSNNVSVMVRAALLCVGCDIPAARKVCGFVGHQALKGCSKCLLSFPTAQFGEKGDYSNFNTSNWEPRTNTSHREIASQYRKCNTRSQQYELERQYGVRYSILLELPYFDAPRMCIVDPMHNLLLGTAKHMVELWKSLNIISPKQYDEIQARVDSHVCPSDIGRVPSKISSSFSGFTADQWKNWTLFFSLFSLKGILPWQHYNCWQAFAYACYLICHRSISQQQLHEADALLKRFCHSFSQLYGTEHCTMNMHLHLHLSECILDYGPVYAFWCFAFERMNGILGSYHTNNHYISVQFANRFLDSKSYAPINWPPEFREEFYPVIKRFSYNKGSLKQTTRFNSELNIVPLPPIKEHSFLSWEVESLQMTCNRIYEPGSYINILLLHKRTKALLANDFVLGAEGSQHSRSSLILAERVSNSGAVTVNLAQVLYYASCTIITSEGDKNTIWFAAVKWIMEHQCKVWFGHPTQVWSSSFYPGYFYIPISSIKSQVIYTNHVVNFGRVIGSEKVHVITPLEVL